MNERIRELADEAAKFSAVMALPTGEPGDKLFVEKFAELIVFDAIAKIESVGFKSSNDIPFEITDLFVSQIKQHFGVEE